MGLGYFLDTHAVVLTGEWGTVFEVKDISRMFVSETTVVSEVLNVDCSI